jgi:RNA polymerase sigma factor (sigma-70 family)
LLGISYRECDFFLHPLKNLRFLSGLPLPFAAKSELRSMNFTKLRNHDLEEWRLLQPRVYGIVFAVAKKTWGDLTDNDLNDIAAETYELALKRIADIEEENFLAWLSNTARNKARTRGKKRSAIKSVEGKSDSIETLQEQGGVAADQVVEETPLTAMDAAERLLLFDELFSLVSEEDRNLLYDQIENGMTGRELAEKYGWGEKGEKSASSRRTKAINRMRKVFASDPRAVKLLSALDIELPTP